MQIQERYKKQYGSRKNQHGIIFIKNTVAPHQILKEAYFSQRRGKQQFYQEAAGGNEQGRSEKVQQMPAELPIGPVKALQIGAGQIYGGKPYHSASTTEIQGRGKEKNIGPQGKQDKQDAKQQPELSLGESCQKLIQKRGQHNHSHIHGHKPVFTGQHRKNGRYQRRHIKGLAQQQE